MKPVDQQIMHDPENGMFGDCQRACIASLLELPYDQVPHFFESGVDEEFARSLADFLAEHKLVEMYCRHHNLSAMLQSVGDCYHMIYGQTERGSYHAVVGLNGKMVHDPHPSRAGLVDMDGDDTWYTFLVPLQALTERRG